MMARKYNLETDDLVIDTDTGRSTSKEITSTVRCPDCGGQRQVKNRYIQKQRDENKFTGRCLSCNAKANNRKWSVGFHPRYSGPTKITQEGYRALRIKSLRNTPDYELAKSMSYSSGNVSLVLEHRLLIAKQLGRPLTKDEVVHHKNGNKADNRSENLELLTIQSHHKGHGDIYYQKWQEAEAELNRLRNLLAEHGILADLDEFLAANRK